jgi:hypothetical protein
VATPPLGQNWLPRSGDPQSSVGRRSCERYPEDARRGDGTDLGDGWNTSDRDSPTNPYPTRRYTLLDVGFPRSV